MDPPIVLGGIRPPVPPVPTPEQDPADVARRADEILARPDFRPEPKGLVERAFDAVGDLLGDLFGTLVDGGGSSLVAWAILGLLAVAVTVLVLRWVRTVRPDAVRTTTAAAEVRRPAVAWLRDAEAHEARGEWREALRCRYRALVGDLIARRLLRDVPGRTAGEYRADLAEAAPSVAPAFAGATELFELAWYGDRPTGPGESSRFQALAEKVVAEVGA